jgi:hypothetical protein
LLHLLPSKAKGFVGIDYTATILGEKTLIFDDARMVLPQRSLSHEFETANFSSQYIQRSAAMHNALEESPVQDSMQQFCARPSISLAKVVLLIQTMYEIGKWMFKNSESRL